MSRLFHDMISPVSATMNGVELLQEYGDADQDEIASEALDLVANSSRNASSRLIFFRIAYGGAGSTADFRISESAGVIESFLASRNIGFTLECPEALLEQRPDTGGIKSIFNLVMIAADSLPKGGGISLKVEGEPGKDTAGFTVMAKGQGASIPGSIKLAFENAEAGLMPDTKEIIGLVAARVLERFSVKVDMTEVEDQITMSATVRMGEPPIG